MDLRLIERVRRLQRVQAHLDRSRSTEPEIIRASSLLEYVPRLSPQFAPPWHLRRFAELLERAPHGRLRVVVAVPPRRGKTELIMHAVPWWLKDEPSLPVMYLTYGAKLAYSKSRRMRSLSLRGGIRLMPDARGKSEWLTPEEGGLRAAGVGGDVTGHGAGVLVIDDAHKNRKEAESAEICESIWEMYTSTARSRLEPDGSIFIVGARWNNNDLSARAIAAGYEYLNIPAYDEETRQVLWPERFTEADLVEPRSNPYDWASLYMGSPTPRDARCFGAPVYCKLADIPRHGRRANGVDLAHSTKTRADPHACVSMLERDEYFYVTDVRHPARGTPITDELRDGVVHPGFVRELQAVRAIAGSHFGMYTGRDEEVVLELLAALGRDGIAITARRARSDKWQRAQPYAAAWKAGRVLIPIDAPWADDFVREHVNFPGGAFDDQVDAGATAYDMLVEGKGGGITTPNKPDPHREIARPRLRKGRLFT